MEEPREGMTMEVRVRYQEVEDDAENNRVRYGAMKEEVAEFPDGDSIERWVDDLYPQWDNGGCYGIVYGHFRPEVYDMAGNLLYARKDPEWT